MFSAANRHFHLEKRKLFISTNCRVAGLLATLEVWSLPEAQLLLVTPRPPATHELASVMCRAATSATPFGNQQGTAILSKILKALHNTVELLPSERDASDL